MELIFEIIITVIFDGLAELALNKNISKWIRYPIIAFLLLLIATVTIGLLVLGIFVMRESLAGGIILALLGAILTICSAYQIIKSFKKKKHHK